MRGCIHEGIFPSCSLPQRWMDNSIYHPTQKASGLRNPTECSEFSETRQKTGSQEGREMEEEDQWLSRGGGVDAVRI